MPAPRIAEVREVLTAHLLDHYAFHGEYQGVRIARKHIIWYTRGLAGSHTFRQHMNTLDTTDEQLHAVHQFFEQQMIHHDRLVYEALPVTPMHYVAAGDSANDGAGDGADSKRKRNSEAALTALTLEAISA